jgi:rRNA maturation endonuclease Nob1
MSWILRIFCKACGRQVKVEMPGDKKCPDCGSDL